MAYISHYMWSFIAQKHFTLLKIVIETHYITLWVDTIHYM